MRCRALAALLSSMVLLAPPLRAEGTEPQIYFFWSASCPYSKAARTFLAGAQAKDARLRIRNFEVEESDANMRLLGRLYEKIGLPEFMVVPLVVVGHHVVIGYDGDETTGAEILSDVAECRQTECKDAVHDLIEQEGRLDEVIATASASRVACERNPVGLFDSVSAHGSLLRSGPWRSRHPSTQATPAPRDAAGGSAIPTGNERIDP